MYRSLITTILLKFLHEKIYSAIRLFEKAFSFIKARLIDSLIIKTEIKI